MGAGAAELGGDGVDLRQVGIAGARQPAAAAPVGGADERGGELAVRRLQQRQGLRAGAPHQLERAAGADVDDGDDGERRRRAAPGGRVRRRWTGR